MRGRGAALGVGNGSWLQYKEASLASSTKSEARDVGVDLFDLLADTFKPVVVVILKLFLYFFCAFDTGGFMGKFKRFFFLTTTEKRIANLVSCCFDKCISHS